MNKADGDIPQTMNLEYDFYVMVNVVLTTIADSSPYFNGTEMNKKRLKVCVIILMVLIVILYWKYRTSEPSRIFERYSSAVVTIYNYEKKDNDGNVKEQSSFSGLFINNDGLVLTILHGFSVLKPEYVVEYLDKDDNPTTSTFIPINGRATDDLIILSPTKDVRIKNHIKLSRYIDIKVGDEIYILPRFTRRDYKKGNLFNVRGIIPATIIAKLENNLFAIDSLSFHGMSGSPILNKSGKLIGYIVSVSQQKSELTDTNVEYNLPDGTEGKIPYVVSITRYSLGRHIIWNNIYNWIKKVERDYQKDRKERD